eukprot:TRINITY_DN57525_c0_g1_i1.p1 TRINITY_DN57525_c0_g1~~TRINITY_DN57525_c0_g1_i1.p1  ORF type:complete len:148 (+),score=21.75 TRINITY_DN57525_c0_g1_i1:37-480(+)
MWAMPDFQVVNTFVTVTEDRLTLPVQRSSSAPSGFSWEFILGLQQKETRKLQQKEIHDAGHCKPCAYLVKVETCRWGDFCAFCHLCLPGEFARQKKLKRKEKKDAYRLLARHAVPCCPAEDEREAESERRSERQAESDHQCKTHDSY